jgi:hypothetical protein
MKQPKLLDLRPTQFVLGMKEIESKIAKIEAFDRKEIIAYCDEHIIPVVIGPKKELYMVDHHHFAYACWELNVGAYSVKVLEDLSHKTEQDFWNFMIRKKWCYLNDQFGMGPHSPYALPSDIRCLADDPYRSLVWAVIDAGLIKKDTTPFFEFMWAEYFRFNLDIHLHAKSNFKNAITEAKKLARSKNAKTFPGFVGK